MLILCKPEVMSRSYLVSFPKTLWYRIIAWFGLEETLNDYLGQPPYHGRDMFH